MTGVWNPVAVFDDDGRDDEVREIVEEAVDILHPDADTAVELRALAHTGPARTGVFRDRNALAADADALDLSGRCKGVYVTIQRARAVVPAIDRLVAGGRGVGNADIDYRQWLPIDLDPVRPSGTSSTDTELVAAIDLANQIAGDLVERGVPVGALVAAQSGNGAHLLVRCSLPADDGGLTRRLLVGLDRRYSTATVRVDTAVHNAARIWRLYGTVARKGDPADPDRPHRRGRILRRPTPGAVAPVAALVALAGREPTPPRRSGLGCTTSDSRFDGHAIAIQLGVYRSRPGQTGGTIYEVSCPWRDHGRGDRAAWLLVQPNGAIAAGCHHSHCADESWGTLRRRLQAMR